MKEIAYPGIVAVTVNDFVAEVCLVMPEFILNIRQLRIKIIIPCRPRSAQIFVG